MLELPENTEVIIFCLIFDPSEIPSGLLRRISQDKDRKSNKITQFDE